MGTFYPRDRGGHPALGQNVLGGIWKGDNLHYYYWTVFQSDYAISQPQGHWDQIACNLWSKRKRQACVGEARQQSAKKWKQYTNFSDTDRAEISQYTAIIGTTCLLVKMEGGAKIGTANSEDKIANYLNWSKNGKIAKVSHTQNIIALRYCDMFCDRTWQLRS